MKQEVLLDSFEKFIRIAKDKYAAIGKEYGLSVSQCIILKTVDISGGNKVSELADYMNITPSAITSLTDKLIKANLIIRERDENDRRIVWLKISNEGKEVIKEIGVKRNEMITDLHMGLDEKEIETISNLYQKIYKANKHLN